jgi:hypothetical protein
MPSKSTKLYQGALERYVLYGTDPGHFLRRVLGDQLTEAAFAADVCSKSILCEIAMEVYETVPDNSRGSPEVAAWMSHGGHDGLDNSQSHADESSET